MVLRQNEGVPEGSGGQGGVRQLPPGSYRDSQEEEGASGHKGDREQGRNSYWADQALAEAGADTGQGPTRCPQQQRRGPAPPKWGQPHHQGPITRPGPRMVADVLHGAEELQGLALSQVCAILATSTARTWAVFKAGGRQVRQQITG